MPAEERAFLEALVDRFEHHPRLIWAVAEEYSERFSAARVSNIAGVIREADDDDHPIAVHKLSGIGFDDFADDANVDQFAMQLGESSPVELHGQLVAAWSSSSCRRPGPRRLRSRSSPPVGSERPVALQPGCL